jgi:hypothetical protein
VVRLRYKQYRVEDEGSRLVLERSHSFPLIVVRLALFLVPESILLSVLKKATDNPPAKIEGITLKQSIGVISRICGGIAKTRSGLVFKQEDHVEKRIILVQIK